MTDKLDYDLNQCEDSRWCRRQILQTCLSFITEQKEDSKFMLLIWNNDGRWYKKLRSGTVVKKWQQHVMFYESSHVYNRNSESISSKHRFSKRKRRRKNKNNKKGATTLFKSKAAVSIFPTFTEERTKISLQVLFFSRCPRRVQSGGFNAEAAFCLAVSFLCSFSSHLCF